MDFNQKEVLDSFEGEFNRSNKQRTQKKFPVGLFILFILIIIGLIIFFNKRQSLVTNVVKVSETAPMLVSTQTVNDTIVSVTASAESVQETEQPTSTKEALTEQEPTETVLWVPSLTFPSESLEPSEQAAATQVQAEEKIEKTPTEIALIVESSETMMSPSVKQPVEGTFVAPRSTETLVEQMNGESELGFTVVANTPSISGLVIGTEVVVPVPARESTEVSVEPAVIEMVSQTPIILPTQVSSSIHDDVQRDPISSPTEPAFPASPEKTMSLSTAELPSAVVPTEPVYPTNVPEEKSNFFVNIWNWVTGKEKSETANVPTATLIVSENKIEEQLSHSTETLTTVMPSETSASGISTELGESHQGMAVPSIEPLLTETVDLFREVSNVDTPAAEDPTLIDVSTKENNVVESVLTQTAVQTETKSLNSTQVSTDVVPFALESETAPVSAAEPLLETGEVPVQEPTTVYTQEPEAEPGFFGRIWNWMTGWTRSESTATIVPEQTATAEVLQLSPVPEKKVTEEETTTVVDSLPNLIPDSVTITTPEPIRTAVPDDSDLEKPLPKSKITAEQNEYTADSTGEAIENDKPVWIPTDATARPTAGPTYTLFVSVSPTVEETVTKTPTETVKPTTIVFQEVTAAASPTFRQRIGTVVSTPSGESNDLPRYSGTALISGAQTAVPKELPDTGFADNWNLPLMAGAFVGLSAILFLARFIRKRR